MNMKEATEKKNLFRVAEAAVIAIVVILFSCFFDYRYAMNDDVFVNAIISGKYSGMPDVHNVSIATPLNFFFCLLYRIYPTFPWFGCSMILCQFYSVYSVVTLLQKKLNINRMYEWCFIIAVNILMLGIMADKLVIVQYTYTAALLMSSATIRLYSMNEVFLDRRWLIQFAGILLQYMFAYCLRTEMFWFLLPFSVLFTLIWYYRKNGLCLKKTCVKQWILIWGCLLFGAAVMHTVNVNSYTDEEWAEYKKVDEYRTQLYDFLTIPDYEENKAFYESAGISEAQYSLLNNYNFSLDDDITSETLRSVVDYADEKRISKYGGVKRLYYQIFTLPLKEGLWSYGHRVLFDPAVAGDDYPWNFVCAALYGVLFLLTCFSGRVQNFVYMVLMFSGRTVLWMYVILKQRAPVRITHSLFVIEIVCLLMLVIEELSWLKESKKLKQPRLLYTGLAILFLAGAGTVAFASLRNFQTEYENTVSFNEDWEELLTYCEEQKDNFYFMDVYSTVNYSEAIFANRHIGPDNYDICGGWLAKSPLCGEKYEQFGISSVREALLENDNVYFVADQGADLEWLSSIYEEQGIQVVLEMRDSVAEKFDIYQIKRKIP